MRELRSGVRTVDGGSRSYVERATKGLTAVELATPVRSLRRTAEGIEIRDDDEVHHVDRAVIATHADEALALLADPTVAEQEVLRAFRYSRNQCVLHTDATILPNARWARASWNYRVTDCRTACMALEPVVVSYDMNRLHRIAEPVRYVVSLNASGRIREDAVVEQMTYDHPFTPSSRSRPSDAFPSSRTSGWPSPAPTTVGVSTRTGACPGSARPPRSGSPGERRPRSLRLSCQPCQANAERGERADPETSSSSQSAYRSSRTACRRSSVGRA